MRDHDADTGRRLWASCPACDINHPDGAYMLGYELGEIWAQCPSCDHRWWHSTGVGVGDGDGHLPGW